jgi:hypothetical protein
MWLRQQLEDKDPTMAADLLNQDSESMREVLNPFGSSSSSSSAGGSAGSHSFSRAEPPPLDPQLAFGQRVDEHARGNAKAKAAAGGEVVVELNSISTDDI